MPQPRTSFRARLAKKSQFYVGVAVVVCLGALGLAAGCSSPDSSDSDGPPVPALVVDDNNYRASASLSIPAQETAADGDVEICWDAVTSDLSCHGVDPTADVNNVALLRFLNLSQADVERRLAEGTLAQAELDGYLDFQPASGDTCASLSSLTLFGTQVDVQSEYTESPDHTYLLVLTRGTVPGVGALSMTFLQPSSTSSAVDVAGNPGCGLLDFDADLASLQPVEVRRDGPWVLDWGDLTRDGIGSDFAFERIDRILVAFYAGATVAELESEVMDLEVIASSLWEFEHEGGHEADLAAARDRDGGEPFPGFDRDQDGVWVLGLLCETCQNPAPLLLTILEPVEGNR